MELNTNMLGGNLKGGRRENNSVREGEYYRQSLLTEGRLQVGKKVRIHV